ncbi:hypothetical protein [Actinomadura sp. HBU206391]|uniref:hypothetical protein n=1 Tax=Actinomadura sp. HBU206391 TaxID=2731692 RepID=UPI0021C6AB76|nr:hypothetical protein [Actinomadura sp. HBU206391]
MADDRCRAGLPGHAALAKVAARRGARAAAEQALTFSGRARFARLAVVDGAVGIAVAVHGRLSTVMTFTVIDGKIAEIEVIADPVRLRRLDLAVIQD